MFIEFNIEKSFVNYRVFIFLSINTMKQSHHYRVSPIIYFQGYIYLMKISYKNNGKIITPS